MGLSTFLNGRAADTPRGLMFLGLSESATITRRTATSDSGGGASWAWNAIGTAACRLYPATTAVTGRAVGGALSESTTHFVRFQAGADVQLPDRIVIANRGTFEVTAVQERTGELSRLVEVMETV